MSQKNRKVLRRAWIILAGLAGMFIFAMGVVFWISSTRLERRLEAIRAAGDPVSIADIKSEAISPEKDAVTHLRRAMGDAKLLAAKLESVWKDRPQQPTCLNDAEIAAIEAAFAAYPEVIPMLEQAAACPSFSLDFGEDPANPKAVMEVINENAQERRIFARLLYRDRFLLLLSKGKHDEAVQGCVTLLKLCRHFEKDPALVNFLCVAAFRSAAIRSANEALQSGRIHDNIRQELENELAKIDIRREYLQALKSERACVLDNFENMRGGMPVYSGVFLNRERIGCLDVLDWMIAQAAAGLPENASKPPTNISPIPPASGPLGQLLIPSLQAAEAAAGRVEAAVRVLRVINALGRRDDPQKVPLPDLSDLGLPKSVTIDPFSDKPLVVKKVDGGWLVYSVGENEVDDGGDVDDSGDSKPLDIGLRPVVRTKHAAAEPKSQ